MRHAIVLLATLTLTSVNACGLADVGDGLTLRVQGTVTAADDGTPVAGVTLLVVGFSSGPAVEGYTTLASGDYSLSFTVLRCGESEKRIIVSHPGFLDSTVGMTCREESQTIDGSSSESPPKSDQPCVTFTQPSPPRPRPAPNAS